MLHFTLVGTPDSAAKPPEPVDIEPTFSPLTECVVRARDIHIHRVDSNGRIREAVRDRQGLRLVFSTDDDFRDFHAVARIEMAGQVGHFAFVARDPGGRYQGRRDFWTWQTEAQREEARRGGRLTPEEKLRKTIAAERSQREEAERALELAQTAAAEAQRRVAELEAAIREAQAQAEAQAEAIRAEAKASRKAARRDAAPGAKARKRNKRREDKDAERNPVEVQLEVVSSLIKNVGDIFGLGADPPSGPSASESATPGHRAEPEP